MPSSSSLRNRRRFIPAICAAGLVVLLSIQTRTPPDRRPIGDALAGVVALTASGAEGDGPFRGYRCGGVLVDVASVATSAHCVIDEAPDDLRALMGVEDLCGATGHGDAIEVESIEVDPRYERVSGRFDLAILRLATAAPGDRRRVAPTATVVDGGTLTAVGWGGGQGLVSCRLRSVGLRRLSDARCAALIPTSPRAFDPDSMLCADPEVAGVDTCSGDSGGPVLVGPASPAAPVVGLVSWGLGCGNGVPGVYSRIDRIAA